MRFICGHHADMDTCPKCAENWRESCRMLDALEPRQCACGAPTGSVALDTCEACDGAPVQSRDETRARRAIRDMHALALDSHARARMDAQGAQEGGR